MPKCDFNKVACVASQKLFRNFVEIALRHGCSPVNLLHILRTPFIKNTSGGLLLKMAVFDIMKKLRRTRLEW